MQEDRYAVEIHDWRSWAPQAPAFDSTGGFDRTPFQRWGFLKSFYREKPAGCRDVLVSVVDRRAGSILMLLPLVLYQRHGLRRIEAADLGLSDYVAPIIAETFDPTAGEIEAIWQEIITALPAADVLSLKKMPAEIAPGRANPLTLLKDVMDMGVGTKIVPLVDDRGNPSYRRSGYYKEGMRHLRRARAACGNVRFHVATTEAEANAQFDELLSQRATRAREMGRNDPLLRPHVQNFYRGMFADCIANGDVLFGALYFDGQCVATDLGLIDNGTHHGVLTSMTHGPLRRFSPGTIAHVLMLDESLARGIARYDLGVGDFAYKRRLDGRQVPLFERHQALTLRGQVGRAEAMLRRAIRLAVNRTPALRKPAHALRAWLGLLRHRSISTIAIVVENPVVQGATWTTLGAI